MAADTAASNGVVERRIVKKWMTTQPFATSEISSILIDQCDKQQFLDLFDAMINTKVTFQASITHNPHKTTLDRNQSRYNQSHGIMYVSGIPARKAEALLEPVMIDLSPALEYAFISTSGGFDIHSGGTWTNRVPKTLTTYPTPARLQVMPPETAQHFTNTDEWQVTELPDGNALVTHINTPPGQYPILLETSPQRKHFTSPNEPNLFTFNGKIRNTRRLPNGPRQPLPPQLVRLTTHKASMEADALRRR